LLCSRQWTERHLEWSRDDGSWMSVVAALSCTYCIVRVLQHMCLCFPFPSSTQQRTHAPQVPTTICVHLCSCVRASRRVWREHMDMDMDMDVYHAGNAHTHETTTHTPICQIVTSTCRRCLVFGRLLSFAAWTNVWHLACASGVPVRYPRRGARTMRAYLAKRRKLRPQAPHPRFAMMIE